MTLRSDRSAARLPPPDFAIVGAPKCGTTALFSYLASHPGIAMSASKEPLFWSADIERRGRVADRAAYEALWAQARPGALRGEASPEYLRSRVAVPALLAARPDVRLIAMLRNPVDLVASLHSNLVFGALEDVPDLEAAWRLQEDRRRGESLPRDCNDPVLLQYAEYAALGDQLERLTALVPAAQRLVVLLDDLRADPRAEYLRVLAFLGLDDDGRRVFDQVHPNRRVRSPAISGMQRTWGSRLAVVHPAIRRVAHALGLRPLAMLERLNSPALPRKPMRPEFRAELLAAFAPQVEKIERLLERDLSAWKAPSG